MRLSAKQRYLQSKNWENQCICLCVEQLTFRDISCSSSPSGLSFQSEDIVLLLRRLARRHRLHIIHLLPEDVISALNMDSPYEKSQYEKDALALFVDHGIVESGLPSHKILFCTTKKGKSSMVRQLLPTLYIDSDEVVLMELAQHLSEVVQITPLVAAGGVAPNVFLSSSVMSYFAWHTHTWSSYLSLIHILFHFYICFQQLKNI